MKKLTVLFFACIFLLAFSACKKEAALNDDFSDYNPDGFVATALDDWLTETFVDAYNIEVVYHYNRYMTDVAKDVSPPKLDKVKPQMEAVLNGFLLPYGKIAGETFIKKNTPKQFVLFGSGAYQDNGTVILGTADGGRRVVLYRVNDFTPNAATVKGNLRTIHHEFTHILNQLVRIPTDFEQVNKADYLISWNQNSPQDALNLGFISQYSRSSPGEDFAEMVAHLLVEGQLWFDNRLRESTDLGKEKLRLKEQIVVDYFSTNLSIDFRALQREVQAVLTTTYENNEVSSFSYWLNQGLFESLTYNKQEGHYVEYGRSGKFESVYDALDEATTNKYSAQYGVDYLRFSFEPGSVMTVRFGFTGAGSSSQYNADYTFTYQVNTETNEVIFTKIDQADTEGTYSNASLFTAEFSATIEQYLTTHVFIADWIPETIEATKFQTFGGFYVKGDRDNYFYGPLVRRK